MIEDKVRLIVVSNRLPIAIEGEGKDVTVKAGKGGLVTAIAPVLKNRGGLWIGWSGAPGKVSGPLKEEFKRFAKEAGYGLQSVSLTEEEISKFYKGFANEIIWPLFHDFQSRCNFDPEYYKTYLAVNEKFADAIAKRSRESDYCWVHDYHLMHVGAKLKELGVKRKMGFFLHIPFPPIDIYLKNPWRAQIVNALLDYDLVGFQTLRDRRNFQVALKTLFPGAVTRGRGPVMHVEHEDRKVNVGYFPISINFKDFSDLARSRECARRAEEVHDALKKRTLVFGADRLDYTKGIPHRLKAMRAALELYPELHGKVKLVQVVVPSRESVPEYLAQKNEIDALVGEINGQFSRPDWIPVHYLYRNLNREELTAYYRAARIALITPLRDGMNLVAKEYCAANLNEDGVLVLSEFTGAAAQLQNGAILVNPHDVEGIADALYQAFKMTSGERRERMHKLRSTVRKYDIFWWVDSFLEAAFGRQLMDFPREELVDYSADVAHL
jgi:trehalose 6-phosphate synthase